MLDTGKSVNIFEEYIHTCTACFISKNIALLYIILISFDVTVTSSLFLEVGVSHLSWLCAMFGRCKVDPPH